MKFLKYTFLFLFSFYSLSGFSQSKYRIYFSDKNNVEFNPYSYFDQKAIERRLSQNIPFDKSDYPLDQNYVNMVSSIVDSTGFQSRWLNFISVYVSGQQQIQSLSLLTFIKRIEYVKPVKLQMTENENKVSVTKSSNNLKEQLKKQTQRLGLEDFEAKNLDGKGIRIAVFDGGFPEVNTHPAFEQLRNDKRIIKTWDFIKNKENVYYGNQHGRMTLACIGGLYEGIKIGMATGAEYLLAKTEIGLEPYSEEEHWLAAAEWADKNGADIISSSLGYGYQRYFTADMNGKTSLVVKAAEMAARKGILVVNSAGNEADTKWETLITPADGDSVLAIGGIDPESDLRISFSSYGPTADKRMKPNVSAYGLVVSCSKDGLKITQGTSFSAPLIAGFAACAWQSNRNLTNMQLFDEIEKSGHLYPYFDYSHGFGIPQASFFTDNAYDITKYLPTFNIIENDNQYVVEIIPGNYNQTKWMKDNNYFFYHITGPDGVIEHYYVLFVTNTEILRLNKADFIKGQIVQMHFRGNTKSITF